MSVKTEEILVSVCAAILLVLSLGWVACDQSSRGNGPGGAKEQAKCLDVSPKKVEHLAAFLDDDSHALRPLAKAVRSNDYRRIYFIAAELDAPGLEGTGDIGVWASNRIEPYEGLVWAISGVARNFSVAPKGDETKFNITAYSHGVAEARRCLAVAQGK